MLYQHQHLGICKHISIINGGVAAWRRNGGIMTAVASHKACAQHLSKSVSKNGESNRSV